MRPPRPGPSRRPRAGPLSGLTRADVAMIVTRGQAWRDALHRDLAQLGLEWPDADSLMEDCSVGGMDLNLYWRAQRVIREHRDMQETLFHASRIADGTSRRTLTEAAAEHAAAGPGRVDADPCTDGGRGDHPALGPVRYAPGRRDVHFALESAVPTVILECKTHISSAKCTSRRGSGPTPSRQPRTATAHTDPRRPRPADHDSRRGSRSPGPSEPTRAAGRTGSSALPRTGVLRVP